MAKKYHISSSGYPSVCKARYRKCPRGGNHYDSVASAWIGVAQQEIEGLYDDLVLPTPNKNGHGKYTVRIWYTKVGEDFFSKEPIYRTRVKIFNSQPWNAPARTSYTLEQRRLAKSELVAKYGPDHPQNGDPIKNSTIPAIFLAITHISSPAQALVGGLERASKEIINPKKVSYDLREFKGPVDLHMAEYAVDRTDKAILALSMPSRNLR